MQPLTGYTQVPSLKVACQPGQAQWQLQGLASLLHGNVQERFRAKKGVGFATAIVWQVCKQRQAYLSIVVGCISVVAARILANGRSVYFPDKSLTWTNRGRRQGEPARHIVNGGLIGARKKCVLAKPRCGKRNTRRHCKGGGGCRGGASTQRYSRKQWWGGHLGDARA